MSHKCGCNSRRNNKCNNNRGNESGFGFGLGEGNCGISPCCIIIALAIFFSGRNRC